MKIILSSRNRAKVEQVRRISKDYQFSIFSLEDLGIQGEAAEDGSYIWENSIKKARYAFQRLEEPEWVMADDTGIFIRYLGGAPGVHSARWAGNVDEEAIARYTLLRMHGANDRGAYFETVVSVISPEGEERFFRGVTEGTVLSYEQAKPRSSMPYSGIFLPKGSSKVQAEMSFEELDFISNRAKGFRNAFQFIQNSLKIRT